MAEFKFPKPIEEVCRKSPVPFAVYRFVRQKVVTVALSQGFLDLFGIESYESAVHLMNFDMYRGAHPDDAARLADLAYHFVSEGETYDAVYRNRNKNQKDYHIIHSRGKRIRLADGSSLFFVWYMDETGDRKAAPLDLGQELETSLEESIHIGVMARKNRYDDLTGLPNMSYFLQRAEEAKPKIQAEGGEPVILYMDFSNMKFFNYRQGFEAGNRLIRAFGTLLRSVFGAEQAGRFSGDHFAAFTDGRYLEGQLDELMGQLKTLNGGNVLPLRIGIYRDSFEPMPATTACDRAKIACDSVRGSYSSKYVYYDRSLHGELEMKEYVFSHFEQALAEKWIQPWFQPIVSSKTGKVTDEEALARWVDPDRGILPPARFIPVLENADLLYRLDLYMVDEVITALRRKKEMGLVPVPVSVNLSLRDFMASSMKEEISSRLEAAGVGKNYLNIEITEESIGQDPELLKQVIDDFHTSGFSIWLDDFGSKYSSLNILDNYHFELIKLDMDFMRRFHTHKTSRLVVEGIIDLARKAGVETVSEGVETEEQAAFLKKCGCTKQQGFLYSRPLPFEKLLDFYAGRHGK